MGESQGLIGTLREKLVFFNKVSLIYQILIPVIILLAVILTFSNKSMYQNHKNTLESLIYKKVERVLELVSESSVNAVKSADKKALKESAEEIMEDEEILFAAFYDKSGNALTQEATLRPGQFIKVKREVLDNDNGSVGSISAFISKAYIIKMAKEAKDSFKTAMIIVILLMAVLLIIIISYLVQYPLKKVNNNIRLLADGDLTKTLDTSHCYGEIKEMSDNLNIMIIKFNELVGTIMKNTSLLASSSEEFSATSKESVHGASEQTEKIETAYSSVLTFHEAIDSIFANSSTAENGAKEASEAATGGQEIIMRAVSNMENTSKSVTDAAEKVNELGKSSKQIGHITAVIREITTKTNLLALNAAIEAARAGEHGLGFAVVADEVRKLAERTTNATKEIEASINSIQAATEAVVELMDKTTNEVGQTAGLVENAGAALNQITEKIHSVSDEIKSIVLSLETQRETTNGIVSDIETVATVAQGFTISAMEASKGSHELSSMAADLENTIHSFKTNATLLTSASKSAAKSTAQAAIEPAEETAESAAETGSSSETDADHAS